MIKGDTYMYMYMYQHFRDTLRSCYKSLNKTKLTCIDQSQVDYLTELPHTSINTTAHQSYVNLVPF